MIEYFTDPHPDEILYSVWARYSDLTNYHNQSDIFEELFGKRQLKPITDLPCHLGNFFENLPCGHDYSIDLLIDRHTLLPFYSPFLPRERYTFLRKQMIEGDGKAVQRRAGSVSVRVPIPLWLRYCPICVEQDRIKFGECYWHRLHQVPGVEVCPLHAVFLENSGVRAQSTFSKKEFVSAERAIRVAIPCSAKSSPLYTILRDIALDSAYLLDHPSPPSGEEFLQKQYRALLAQNKFLTQGALLRSADLVNAFVNHYPAELLNKFNCGVRHTTGKRTWLTTLAYRENHAHHPLHHLLAIRFLGSTLEEFLNQEFERPQPFGKGPWPCLNPVCNYYWQNSIHTCQIIELKKGHFQGKFACDCGFSYSRYSQIGSDHSSDRYHVQRAVLSYGKVWETKLRELWLDQTVSLKKISQRLNISEVGLKWHAIELHLPLKRNLCTTNVDKPQIDHTEQECSWHRSQWLNLLEKYPRESFSKLQAKSPLLYKWLFHNDQEWLDAHCSLRKALRKPRSKTGISLQDKGLEHKGKGPSDIQVADAIKSVADTIICDIGRPKRITMRKIKMYIPELIPLLSHPDKIPLAMQALQEVLETREAFALRRIKWITQKYLDERVYPSEWIFINRANVYRLQHIPQVKNAIKDALFTLSQNMGSASSSVQKAHQNSIGGAFTRPESGKRMAWMGDGLGAESSEEAWKAKSR